MRIMPSADGAALAPAASGRTARRVAVAGLAAALVAAAAQVAVPVPFSPVPMTLQPLAVLLVGALAGPRPGLSRLLLASAAGMAVIHAGGTAHLALLGGDPALAFRVGFVPFLTGDLLKIGLAAGIVLLIGPRLRSFL